LAGLLLGGVWDNDAAGGLLLGIDALYNNAVVKPLTLTEIDPGVCSQDELTGTRPELPGLVCPAPAVRIPPP